MSLKKGRKKERKREGEREREREGGGRETLKETHRKVTILFIY